MSRARWQEGRRGDQVRESLTNLAAARLAYTGQTATPDVIIEADLAAVAAFQATQGVGEHRTQMPRHQQHEVYLLAHLAVSQLETSAGFAS